MKKITILSGKGGVGKSSITASLAIALSKKHKIITADCDVDASNLALVFGLKHFQEWKPLTTNLQPIFDLNKCDSCRKCFESCYFNAIEWIHNKPRLSKFGCEGCGVCEIVCEKNAVKLIDVNNAKIGYGITKYGFNVVAAQLEVGQSGSGKIVIEVKKLAESLGKDAEIMLIDSAAGIGCPVIASVSGSDYVIAVTEPTLSGFSDLKRVLAMVNQFRIPYGIIINKFDINAEICIEIERFVNERNVEILAKISYDRSFIDALVNLEPIIVYDKKYQKVFNEIKTKLEVRLG